MPTRTKVAPGIYDAGAQWHATVHVRGAGFREKRFPIGTPIEDVEAWRQRTRVQLLGTAERGSLPGTFRRDAQRYLRDFTAHLASALDRKYEIQRWIDLFKDVPRGMIKPADVARARAQWLREGKSPKTINNRVDALRHLYHCLDGKKAWTPCDDLDRLHVHKTPMRYVDDATILAVDQKLQQLETTGKIVGAKTRARYRVLVATGRRPSEIMRTERGDLDLERRIWIPRDGKGGFSPGIYLNDDMLPAWELFIAANAWGHYDTHEHAKKLRLAGWPKDVPPYNARHTVGITLSEKGIDLDDIAPMMGHKRRETTRKHYVPVRNSRMQKASEALDGRFGGWTQTERQTTNAAPRIFTPENADSQTAARKAKTSAKRRISSMRTTRKR